jgi:hypothetical protein
VRIAIAKLIGVKAFFINLCVGNQEETLCGKQTNHEQRQPDTRRHLFAASELG